MRCLSVEVELYGNPMVCPIMGMLDIEGEPTLDVVDANYYQILLANGAMMIVSAPHWQVVEKKPN
ncbi:MAG TPA: hypothetical protein VFA65_24160 [Bryobacteraceae bacterium]|nr:hypothetical protein [Bryobacteraceae bacterium]